MIGQATKRETIPSPLGALLPITYQVYSLSQYFILPITYQVPMIFKDNTPHIHLTFFQKLRKCVNEIVALSRSPFTRTAVKGVTVVICIVESLILNSVVFCIVVLQNW